MFATVKRVILGTSRCLLDVIIIIDSSGSVEDTFLREKELAAGIIERLRVGAMNARIALIKFAAKEKVRTVWSFDRPQSRAHVLRALDSITFSSGTTAIHTALLQAITEYTAVKGARPGEATPIGIVFTDGFGQKDTTEAATLLRAIIPNMFAVAINHQYPINRIELERIAGAKERVFTDSNIDELYSMLQRFTSSC
uniref:VWFA domain-containing protein n=1 Tax=Ascaris lumbricoides TaxID=6252 RepID=A0A0M3HH51_ASCLU